MRLALVHKDREISGCPVQCKVHTWPRRAFLRGEAEARITRFEFRNLMMGMSRGSGTLFIRPDGLDGGASLCSAEAFSSLEGGSGMAGTGLSCRERKGNGELDFEL